jgi:hypothetical protein
VENGRVWCILPGRMGQHLRGYCKHKSKKSLSNGTEYGEMSECLHSGEWWAVTATFVNCISDFIVL